MKASVRMVIGFLVICSLTSQSLMAAERRSGGDQAAVAAYQQMLEQAQSERDQLKLQVKKLKDKLASKDKKIKSLQSSTSAKSQTLSRFKSANDKLVDYLKKMRDRMQELIGKYRDLALQLRKAEEAKAKLKQQVNSQKQEIARHAKNNAELYRIDQQLIKRYQNKGVWTALMQDEPVTQIERVKIQNIAQQYQTEIDKLQADQSQHKKKATSSASDSNH